MADPRRFDVVAAPNMLGDVVADSAALVLGSRGMALSANFGDGGRAVYQTGHGAAYDLAGTGRANPVAQIQSLAMLLRESLDLPDAAQAIENAVVAVLAAGDRTADIAGPGSTVLGTRALAERIADERLAHSGEVGRQSERGPGPNRAGPRRPPTRLSRPSGPRPTGTHARREHGVPARRVPPPRAPGRPPPHRSRAPTAPTACRTGARVGSLRAWRERPVPRRPPRFEPRADELVVTKQYYRGFTDPAVDPWLRDRGVGRVVVAGVYAHACVRETALDAYEAGYEVWVGADAVGSTEPAHAALTRAWLEPRAGAVPVDAGDPRRPRSRPRAGARARPRRGAPGGGGRRPAGRAR